MKNLKNDTIIKEAFKNYYNVNDDIIQALSRQYDGLPFHTFQAWKEKGYSIKKGSKGKPVYIWKYATKKQRENEETEKDESGRFIKALAYFFDISQVEKHGSTTPGNKVKMLPALIYSDIRKALYKPMEAPGSSVYIKDSTLYINKYNYRFKLNIENIIKLKSADFNKIISEIKDHDEIITQLLEIYEKKKDIYKYPTDLKTVYNGSILGSKPGKRTERQLKEAIKKNIAALNDLIKDNKGNMTKEQKALYKALEACTDKKGKRPVLKNITRQGSYTYSTNSYIAARTSENLPGIENINNYPNMEKLFNEAIDKNDKQLKLTLSELETLKTAAQLELKASNEKLNFIPIYLKDINKYIDYKLIKEALKNTKSDIIHYNELSTLQPLYIKGNNLEYIVMQCRVPQ